MSTSTELNVLKLFTQTRRAAVTLTTVQSVLTDLSRVSSIKILGVITTSKLSVNDHVISVDECVADIAKPRHGLSAVANMQ